jgi:hypothetical protein
MKIIKWFRNKISEIKRELVYRKKLKELKKRDPFNYKNF